jgi:hypothetical protein
VGRLPGCFKLGDLIADPTSARLFLLRIDWFAGLLQLVFDCLGLFALLGTHGFGRFALALGGRVLRGQHRRQGTEEHSFQVVVNDQEGKRQDHSSAGIDPGRVTSIPLMGLQTARRPLPLASARPKTPAPIEVSGSGLDSRVVRVL